MIEPDASEASQLEAKISEGEKEAQRLRDELARVEEDLRALYRAHEILTGRANMKATAQKSSKGRPSIPALVEQVLREFGEMHADDLVDKIRLRFGYSISKQSITSAISRYIDKGERFVRTGRNKFALKQESD